MLMAEIKKRFVELVNAYRHDEQVLTLIEADMNAIGDYVKEVYVREYSATMDMVLLSGEKYNEVATKKENRRRDLHNKAIEATTQLVECCTRANIKPIYDGDLENRHEVGYFCEKTVISFFAGRDKFKPQNIENYEQIAQEPVRYY